MLRDLDLTISLSKKQAKPALEQLELRLGELQRTAREKGVPLLVVFEGLEASGKGTLINRLIQSLDPRGFQVHPMLAPNEEERHFPFLRRFWIRTPAHGRIAVFDRSWYRRVLDDRVAGEIGRRGVEAACAEINAFERQLVDDGTVIVKFWLHISRKEQTRRFRRLEADKATAWRVDRNDWKQNRRYDRWVEAAEVMLGTTGTASAPWTVIEATDDRHAAVKALGAVVEALGKAVAAPARAPRPAPARRTLRKAPAILARTDLSVSLERPAYEKALAKCQERLRTLEHELYRRRIPLLILYEGWDAAGKGGNIRRVTRPLDPRGYEVIPVAAPTEEERSHHYLWRFWKRVPKAGHIAIFDRTWYGRVLVERVEGFCAEAAWRRAYEEINAMERHLASAGAILVKFWLHLSPEEQLRRFRDREKTAHKRWKITEEDYRNRKKWDLYREAVEEMLQRTSTASAPWTVIASECKLHARIAAQKTILAAAEQALG